MAVHFLFCFGQFFVVHIVPEEQNFGGIIHAPILFLSDVNDVSHVREAFAFHPSPLKRFQFGKHLVCHLHIVAVFLSIDDAECVHVGVFAKVFQFSLLVACVYSNSHCADLGAGIKKCQPVGDISCPDAYVCTFLHSDSKQSFRHVVYTLVKLFPCEAQVTVGVYEIFFVGSGFCPMFQPFSQCPFI